MDFLNDKLSFGAIKQTEKTEKNIANLIIEYISIYEPRKAYLKINNKTPFNEFLKKEKGQQIGYEFGVISDIPKSDDKEIAVKFCYWKNEKLLSGEIKIDNTEQIEIEGYISYPIELFSDLIRTAQNYNYFNHLTYLGKPIYFNKH